MKLDLKFYINWTLYKHTFVCYLHNLKILYRYYHLFHNVPPGAYPLCSVSMGRTLQSSNWFKIFLQWPAVVGSPFLSCLIYAHNWKHFLEALLLLSQSFLLCFCYPQKDSLHLLTICSVHCNNHPHPPRSISTTLVTLCLPTCPYWPPRILRGPYCHLANVLSLPDYWW